MNDVDTLSNKILFVDDSLLMHEFVKKCFSDGKYAITYAINGDEAYELYSKNDFSMIITDIEMPVMNGLELCKKIKENNNDKYIPVVIMSSIDNTFSIETAFEYGADDYVVKTPDFDMVRKYIDEYFQNMERRIKSKILIVDDDKLIQEIIRHAFIKNGFRADTAKNGKEALALIEQGIPDIVITDVLMPIMDGYQLCEKIRDQTKYDKIEIIITSSRDKPSDLKRFEKFSIRGYFTKPFDVNKLLIMAERVFIDKANDYKKEIEHMLSSIKALVRALEAKDQYTKGHSVRVTEYATLIAKGLNVSQEYLNTIEIAASLHDIGKIGIKDEVLLNPGVLTEEEYNHIKEHPYIGHVILKEIPSLKEVLPLVYLHHERWNGNGYPEGLSGQDIPLGARIIGLADAFDAMTSARPYRDAMSKDMAIEIIKAESGKQFCGMCADVLIELYEKKCI